MTRPKWLPDWSGQTVVVVASGPSAAAVPLQVARDRARFVAVNNSWRLCPWADILLANDYRWWVAAEGCRGFAGLKLCTEPRAATEQGWNVRHVKCVRGDDRLVLAEPGTIGWGSSSGFGAFNLAIQTGATKILLVGFDARLDLGQHWHASHPKPLNNPSEKSIMRWRRAMDAAARQLRGLGVTVINCSAESALRAYPKMGFEEALAT